MLWRFQFEWCRWNINVFGRVLFSSNPAFVLFSRTSRIRANWIISSQNLLLCCTVASLRAFNLVELGQIANCGCGSPGRRCWSSWFYCERYRYCLRLGSKLCLIHNDYLPNDEKSLDPAWVVAVGEFAGKLVLDIIVELLVIEVNVWNYRSWLHRVIKG